MQVFMRKIELDINRDRYYAINITVGLFWVITVFNAIGDDRG